jgi:hypothetical protein
VGRIAEAPTGAEVPAGNVGMPVNNYFGNLAAIVGRVA